MKLSRNYPIAITFDIDWAPDFAIQKCVDILEKYSIPATFFVTHDSPILKDLQRHRLIELGIHPNFLRGSSHGEDEAQVIQFIGGLVENPVSVRTHCLHYNTPLMGMLVEMLPSLRYDISNYVGQNPFVQPYDLYPKPDVSVKRIPFQFEDDLFLNSNASLALDEILFQEATYQIYNFHPIHVLLNSKNSMEGYKKLKKSVRSLSNASVEEVLKFVESGEGVNYLLGELVERVETSRFFKISEMFD